MKLRPYQSACVKSILDAKKEGHRSVLIVVPTGCGKTVIIAAVIQALYPEKGMFIAHRQELVFQARDKISEFTGFQVEIEMGEMKSTNEAGLWTPAANTIISTVQTHTAGGDGGGRMSKFLPEEFNNLYFDETHHATSPSWKRIKEHYFQNPNLFLLGVTATPDRLDEEALGQVFDHVAFEYEIKQAIDDGWLVPIEPYNVPIESLDFSRIRTTAGDLNSGDLAKIMEAEKPLHGVAGSTIEIIGDKRGLGFASSVYHAQTLSNIFNRHRAGMSACVSGKTDNDERQFIVKKFLQGDIQFLWNCDVFGEGFDDPNIDYIVDAKPTKSRSKFAQKIGRGARPHESIAHRLNDCPSPFLRRTMIAASRKPFCTVISFTGDSGRHKLITPADILGGNYSDETVQAVNLILKRSPGRAKKVGELLEEEEKRQIEAKARQAEEEKRKSIIGVARVKYKLERFDPFDAAGIRPVVERGWNKDKPLTEKMISFLKRNEFNPDSFSYARASQLIGLIMERREKKLCTFKQMKLLRKYDYDTNISMEEASELIDRLAENGWQKVDQKL